ncbi:hypothetical protein P3C29_02705 [Pseudomonas sp. 1912-s]|uniref:hypothetical protein n=1 Tax=Pseudomonas sp. 1912-s TaxID=3033802 RepID=UPI0023DF9DA4|nr:hypothetical protein [Pseudomonas sp. 1912-s]MDF3197572.1 hypothetical protein [Pseudomonas sp. 1912-s]
MFSESQIIGRDSFGLEKVKPMNRRQLSRTALQAVALSLIAGQAFAIEQIINVQHDSVRSVTCWILNDTGISCLPDSSLLQQATSSSEAGRASQASSVPENGLQQASPLPQKKGFQL